MFYSSIFSCSSIRFFKAHCPDTIPLGRQQHIKDRIEVVRIIHFGIGTPSSFFAISLEKWLQFHSNTWYWPQVNSISNSSIISEKVVSNILTSPKNIFLLNLYSAVSGSITMMPLSCGLLETTQKQYYLFLQYTKNIPDFNASMVPANT